MVNLLLANKADVNAVDNEGHSVVHWATVCGEVEALRSVLAAGANIAIPDLNGGTPLHYAAQMCGASVDNKVGQANATKLALEILGILLAHPHSSVDVQDKDGRQPLLWAASAGSAKAVIALVKAGARVESADKDGLTALHCAASRGHTECIDTLISLCGAPTDLIDSNGCTALHYAVTLGHADATARLLDLDADPNRQDRKGRTPAHCGCAKGQFETVKLLKERGANLWLRNAKGDLPVHEASSSGRRELVEWLLEQRPKQVNTTSNDGRSLLHIAANNDYTDVCKMLLDYGGDINAIYRNSKGVVYTPLDCALQKGHRATAKFLQSHGGLPASKLRLAARRSNPFHEVSTDMVRPLRYVEKEELHDLQNSKKYVVYLKHSDSDVGGGEGDSNCSCHERTYRREQKFAHTCRRHQHSRRRETRRRTSSCGEPKNCHHQDSGEIDICRSKSNIEIRRRKSRERYASSSEWEDRVDEYNEDDEDSCENCCYHKRQKQRVIRRKSISSRRSKERDGRDRGSEKESSPEKSKVREVEVVREGEEKASEPKEESATEPSNGKEEAAERESRPESATTRTPVNTPGKAAKEATFIKFTQSTETQSMELTDEDGKPAAELVTTQVDVHQEADDASVQQQPDTEEKIQAAVVRDESEDMTKLAEEMKKEVDQVMKIAALALESDAQNGENNKENGDQNGKPVNEENKELVESAVETVETEVVKIDAPATPQPEEAIKIVPNVTETPATPIPTPLPSPIPEATAEEPPTSAAATTTPTQPEEPPSNATDTKPSETLTAPDTTGTETAAPAETKDSAEVADTSKTVPTAAVTSEEKPTPEQRTLPSNTTSVQQPTQVETQKPSRELEPRRSFTLLPSDSAEDEGTEEVVRKSSFQILKSDESGGESGRHQDELELSDSQVFKIVTEPQLRLGKPYLETEASSMDDEHRQAAAADYEPDEDHIDEDYDNDELKKTTGGVLNRHGVGNADGALPTSAVLGVYDYSNGRKRRLKKRVRSGPKTRSNWKTKTDITDGDGEQTGSYAHAAQSSKDQDSGFEPSPRASKSKIPTPRNIYTAHVPRRHIYATLDGRSCSSRLEGRKPGERGACDMSAVTRSIQRNIRRYYMERKIFQHLLELKSLQIRSTKLNEAVLVKRAVDDYHKSCAALGGETGTRLRRYPFSEYTFKNFELFLYETLKALQKPGTYNFQNINEVYEEAERRLSPDYNAYEKALQCTTKTHRCLHAAHAYTGIPCAAYIPMMNHHTMPKFGFGAYKKTGVGSFYLPKILTSGGCGGTGGAGGCGGGGGKVALELSHGKSKQLISLPSDKLDSNKRYYVTFTVKESAGGGGGSGTGGVAGAATAGGGSGADAAGVATDKQATGGCCGGNDATGK
ncbi:protein phosphatase 1 regulatory subunit 12B [Zeugodacus cucurbitae]|uniref:protein phosphatase 1 regulatory subunit 12B n=1 Tax=Zeugodacus cucurbitae TaxID=28588 RepID=UPI0023D95CCE|nr:protein phosphatase 1 regulatory subunit 12B [Zeugodacus cucurbitae]